MLALDQSCTMYQSSSTYRQPTPLGHSSAYIVVMQIFFVFHEYCIIMGLSGETCANDALWLDQNAKYCVDLQVNQL